MLIRQTVLYLPAQLIGPLFQFVAAVVWTHWLLPESYGVLTFIFAAQELAYVLCNGWWAHYMMRYSGNFADPDQQKQYQQSENAVLFGAAILQAAIALVVLRVLDQPITSHLAAATILFMVTRSATTHLLERARTQGFIWGYTVGQMVGPVLGFGLAYLAVRFIAATPESAIGGFALAQTMGLLWLWHSLGLRVVLSMPRRSLLLAAFEYGLPLTAAGIIGWVSLNGVRVVVEHFQGVDAVGLISVGWGLGQRLASVVAMLVTAAAYPLAVRRFQQGEKTAALQQLSDNGALLLALLAPASAGIVLLTPELVNLMIAPAFKEVTLAVLPLAALAGAIRNLRVHFADQVLLLMARTPLMAYLNVVEAVAVVLFCTLGLMVAGPAGATAGCLAGSTLGTILGFALGRYEFAMPLPLAHAARILAATGLMSLILMLPVWAQVVTGELARVIFKVSLGGAIYLGVMASFYPGFVRLGWSKLRTALQTAS